ncbi:MAG: hypothetical protein GKS06_00775 [Acidobacteria bacterium]|nr:hypothetical protein [Acidobacteriota bacterium]
MPTSPTSRVAVIGLAVVLLATPVLTAPAAESSADPLAGFEHLIGGTWTSSSSDHTFEWGVGRKYVRANTYFVDESGEPKLVGQGIWYWDPAAEVIKGISLAIDMPFDVMEMRSRFDGERLINELTTIAADGNKGAYVETWDFTGPNAYEWNLHEGDLDAPVMMSDTFTRR